MPSLPAHGRRLSGTAFCLIAALAYSSVNICMRQLALMESPAVWAVFNRETTSAIVVAPWLAADLWRGRPTLGSGWTLMRLVLVGLLIQVVGNWCVQWAFGVVGLAVSVPTMYGTMITGSVVLGYAWLGERVSPRSIAAIAILLASLVLLGMGAKAIGESIGPANALPTRPIILILAVAAAGLGGATFALLGITVRHSVTQRTSPPLVAFVITLMGTVGLGPVCLARFPVDQMLATPWQQFALMAAAGVLNLVGFLAFIHGLQRTTVAHANVVNASQVAMAALAGMAMFGEPPNPWLLVGVSLTIAGILAFDGKPAEAGGV